MIGRIIADDRHVEVAILHCGDARERKFADWPMRDDPPQSWMWPAEEARSGVIEETAGAQAMAIFRRLAGLPGAA